MPKASPEKDLQPVSFLSRRRSVLAPKDRKEKEEGNCLLYNMANSTKKIQVMKTKNKKKINLTERVCCCVNYL